jgi:hypothetical protein
MAQASTTLLIKTEGVTEGYKDIGKLLGPLQGINHLLYNLNKALGISTKESKAYKQSLEGTAQGAKIAADNTRKMQNDLRAAAKSVTTLNNSSKLMAASFNFNNIINSLSIFKNGIIQLGQEFLSLTTAAEKQARAEGQLQSTLQKFNISGTIDEYKQWASALQSVTTYGDEEILSLANQAAQYTKNEKLTKQLTESALNLAAATGQNAKEAMNGLLRAVNGQNKALQTMGVYLSDSEKETLKTASSAEKLAIVVGKVKQQYAGFAEAMANTPEGAIKQIQNIIGDIKEKLGGVIALPFVSYLKAIGLGLNKILGLTDEATQNFKISGNVINVIGKSLNVLPSILQNVLSGAKGVFFVFKGLSQLVDFVKISVAGWGIAIAKIKGDAKMLNEMLDMGKSSEKAIENMEKMYNAFGVLTDDFSNKLDGLGTEMEKAFTDSINKNNSVSITAKWFKDLQAGMDENVNKDGGLKVKVKPEVEGLDFGNIFGDQVFDTESLSMQSSQMLKIKEDFEAKSLEIEQRYIAQKQALDQMSGNASDNPEQLKWLKDQQLAVEEDYEQRKHDLKIQYATQTNDQVTLMQDKYYQHLKDKESEFAQIQAEWQSSMKSNLEGGLTNAFTSMFEGAIEGQESFREAAFNAFKSMASNVFTTSISAIVKNIVAWASAAGESQAGIPVVGPVLAAAASAAVLATMGAMKAKAGKEAKVQYATGGYVSAGLVHGFSNTKKDSVSALLQPGERVLSKEETKAYDRARNSNGNSSINITINVSGNLSTPEQVRDTVRRVLVPELNSAIRSGYALAR